uniref:Uncharacterized protein n=1 Tax=Periophthalmus magnuspinnatus TaxID=409849 RepID=A0A3B4BFI0_9GOBI
WTKVKMDEPESLDSEMTELQECSYEALESLSQDDEDEVEELQNSLREVIQDHSVKPKLQCLMVDPSFSMVTVQSEDSGIVWETASSRCSTPWASETSSVSEGGSMEGSGAAGKITIIFDEEKVVRRRTRSGRSSRLSDRFSRPGSSRSASALGVERLEMMEVSQPNVKQDKTETEPDLEEIKSMDQQLFSLISEGYEILNIRVPSKLPTVDEEESTELKDNLSYLDQTPKIKSKNHHQWTPVEGEELQDVQSQNEVGFCSVDKQGPVDIDYFEKFTLLDVVAPDEQAAEEQDECVTPVPPPEPEQTSIDTDKNISPPASEESFVFVSDEDIVGEHLDEVFYGEGPPADLVQQSEEDAKGGRMRRQSSVKESGSVLFESEETVLTPIYISSGPPKIIDPILLEEPTAMSFMYSDLYEDAMGERRRSDEEYSEAESVTSEKSYKRCLIDDCEEADSDYLEKFILKDETPNVEVPANIIDDHKGGRMMWSQNEFQMSGCLTRVVAEEDIEETKKGVEIKEISPCEFETASQSALSQIKHENKVSAPDQKEQIVEKSKVTTIDTHAPATDIPQTVIQGDETQVSSIVDALIEDTVLEIPKEIHRDSSLEVSADCEPPVQAHVEVIEKGKTDMQTQVCINLQEEVNLVKKSTSTVEDLGQGGEITTQDDDKMEPLEKPIEGIKQEEVPSEESVAPEIRADVVKEMVNVGELILLVPKGQAVEMDIEISPQPDMSQADQEVDQIDDKLEPIMEIVTQLESELVSKLKEKTAIAKEDVQVFQEPIMETQKYEVEDKAKEDIEASVDETLLSMDQSHEAKEKEVAQTDDNLEPISDIVTQLESEIVSKLKKQNTIAKEDVHLPEEIKEAEFDLEKQEIVSSIPSSILQKEMPSVVQGPLMETQKPEVEDKVKEDIEARVDETPVSMDESHKAEQKTDLKEPICIPAQEIPVTVPETITQVQTAPQLQEKEDTAIITDTKDEDVTTVLTEECLEAEKIDKIVSKMEAVPTIEVDLPPASEEEGQNVALEEQMIASVSTETTKQDWSISPNEAETEELDYEIVNKQEGEESHDIEPEGPKQDLDQHKEIIIKIVWLELYKVKTSLPQEKLSDWISELQGRSENIEDLVSELELAYNSVEVCYVRHYTIYTINEEMMALVMEQYNSMSVSMEEEKKAKLEQLYDQIVSFQESIDSAKSTLETTAREAETDARVGATFKSPEDICARLTAALHSAMSLELGPKGLLVFEDYAKGNTSSSQLAQRKGIAVPQRPTLQVQEPGSATSSSVTVYWKVNPEDVIDCFQVYCMEDPQGAISEEYRVTVKESYCVLEELEPDKTYKVWVMAVNYTGCSLPSARLIFKTAPSVPMIDTEKCTVTWDTAILRWSSVQQTSGLSYTLEYCRQYELEGEGLRTISGITNFEHKVLLQPNENYLFYIKAVSEAGSSEQSEAALISTKGTKFHLQKATAHPALELSVDQTTLHYSQDTHDNMSPSILGEQLPMRGHYYWENDVSRCTDYRLGVAYSSAKKDSPLGESQLSWCLQCTPTPLGCSYHLVHNYIHSSLFVIDLPERVGIFLDYQFGRLSFYNAQSGQLLGSFSKRFTQPCHPAVGMDTPGSVEVCMVQEVPEFIKDS